MGELVPQPDTIRLAEAEWAARVEWAKDQIASDCYVPNLPPKMWAGRDAIIAGVAERFSVPIADAVSAVDAAAMDLCLLDQDDNSPAYKRTALVRLFGIRRILGQAMKDGRKEITYKWVVPEDGGEATKIPFKEKHYVGADMAIVGRILEVERNIAELYGLKGPEEGIQSFSISEEIEKTIEGDKKKKTVLSVAQKLKLSDGPVTDEGKRMIQAALEQMNKQSVKQIESTVVDPGESKTDISQPEEDDDDD